MTRWANVLSAGKWEGLGRMLLLRGSAISSTTANVTQDYGSILKDQHWLLWNLRTMIILRTELLRGCYLKATNYEH